MGKFLVKTLAGEQSFESEAQIRDAFLAGGLGGGDLVHFIAENRWSYVSDLPSISGFFATKPVGSVETASNIVFVPGKRPYQAGPFTLSELKTRINRGEFAPSSWISIEGSTQWKQLREVPALKEAVPPLPGTATQTQPAPPPPVEKMDSNLGEPSIKLDLHEIERESKPAASDGVEREDPTKAFSILGLNLQAPTATPTPTPTPPPQVKPNVPPPPKPAPEPKMEVTDERTFDGITAEIPVEPIWLIKQGNSENVSGPFRFLEVVEFLKNGKLNKNDKISRQGTNRFQKIAQQYEFNVSYSLETVVREGVEVQKIFIRRRHPRVAYMADVQITRQGQILAGRCVNISAGGVMVELPKADLELGETLQMKILPDVIPRQISCAVLVIGKVPKIPPGFAFKFETLLKEDKEAIEYFVNEALKREQAGKQNAG